ncbi:FAD-dependent monooxygenase [Streptomyces sp. ME19-01-6]|uniref:FAD-dependent monooxygenase n=1 Tax=Streptomyces sp. ME19-01-6 TaxID=3028686 RepID=UPI0029B2B767|nr:FAD-dependent monooxygenase [Streptomyces sp. ME19-01-6]MDX3224911.1 FAD-dependent monooxygenase [Streptomyces sp. ME19-01-6]
MTSHRPKAVVIGAGIGGLTLAAALRQVDIDVAVYERATELKAAGSGLGVLSNGGAALDALGIDIGLEKRGQVLQRFGINDAEGNHITWFPIPELSNELGLPPTVVISRSDLQQGLLEAVGDTPITLGAAAVGYETRPDGATVRFADGSQAHGDIVIGADGINSAIRGQITGPEPVHEAGYVCWLAIVPFSHPRFETGSVLHYWGSGQRFGLLDLGHGQTYWFGTKNMSVERAADWQGTKEEIVQAYAGWADEVQAAIRVTPEEDIIAIPARDRAFLEQWGDGRVTLLGDAAHPMLTSLAQGAGMAIEDAVVLAGTLARSSDLTAGLRSYEDQRRERTRAMVLASRALSEQEQLEDPRQRHERDEQLRRTTYAAFAEQQRDVLMFPGIHV